MSKRKITMTVDEKVFAAFKQYCRANAMKVSSKVELMMHDFLAQTDTPQARPAPIDDEMSGREKRGEPR